MSDKIREIRLQHLAGFFASGATSEIVQALRELIEARVEIERVTKDRDDWKAVAESMGESVNERSAEIERLRVALEKERDLACRRQAEIDRVNRDGSDLRQRIDEYDQSCRDQSDTIQRLANERDELNRCVDLQRKQIGHQAKQCQEIETERNEANRTITWLYKKIDTAAAIKRERDELAAKLEQSQRSERVQDQESERLAREVEELRPQVNRLTAERKTLSENCDHYYKLWRAACGERSRAIQTIDKLTCERDEARELLREFRAIWGSPLSAMQAGEAWEDCCKKYDVRYGQLEQPQPEPAELVPWTAETRPKGPMTIRRRDNHSVEVPPQWGFDGAHVNYAVLLAEWEVSRDGKTWNRCGVPRG